MKKRWLPGLSREALESRRGEEHKGRGEIRQNDARLAERPQMAKPLGLHSPGMAATLVSSLPHRLPRRAVEVKAMPQPSVELATL